jgi:hypothetical protein
MEPPNKISSRMNMPTMGVEGVWTITIEAAANGSRVTSNGTLQIKNALARGLAMFMDGNKEEAKTLQTMKTYLESH